MYTDLFWLIYSLGNNKVRLLFYKLFVNPYYKHINSAIIFVNSGLLWIPVSFIEHIL